jgi:hypothetical protein
MNHIVETHGERFKSVETFGVVENIYKRYAQYHDTSAVTSTSGGDTLDRHQQPNGADRWGPGIKEMDPSEEDYFNGDEDEDVEPMEPLVTAEEAEKPLELKRRRSNDEEDDELLQLAQKSPRPGKGNYLRPLRKTSHTSWLCVCWC